MRPLEVVKAPLHALGVLGSTKSFRLNPVVGNPRLNALGLHRWRVAAAAHMAARRRQALAALVPEADRRAFDRDGYVVKPDFLPAADFHRLRARLYEQTFDAREMRQGTTVTRMIPLTASTLGAIPEARIMLDDARVRATMRYVSASGGEPVYHLQTVIAEAGGGPADPQTDLHADTFHATGKCWLFLEDVGEDDGPFQYVPGSHRMTPARLAWEFEQSLTARHDPRPHHAHGSFRADTAVIDRLGYGRPVRMAVPANTLVYADTYGFHARSVSQRPTRRMEIHGYLRGNPFVPWTGPTLVGLPGLAQRQLDIYLAYADWRERRTGRRNVWRSVGKVTPASAPHV